MKKLLITTIIAGLSLATFAKQHKISDMFITPRQCELSEVTNTLKVTDLTQDIDATELTKFKTIATFNLSYMGKAENQAEFDKIISDWISMEKAYICAIFKKDLPLTFGKLKDEVAKTNPVFAEKFDKLGVVQ